MIYGTAIILLICFLFLPIVGVIVGYYEAKVIKSDWENDNANANLIDGR